MPLLITSASSQLRCIRLKCASGSCYLSETSTPARPLSPPQPSVSPIATAAAVANNGTYEKAAISLLSEVPSGLVSTLIWDIKPSTPPLRHAFASTTARKLMGLWLFFAVSRCVCGDHSWEKGTFTPVEIFNIHINSLLSSFYVSNQVIVDSS